MIRYGLSQLDRMENNYESSKENLQAVISYYPEKSILLVDLGMVEMEAGNKERALALITTAYNRNRQDLSLHFVCSSHFVIMTKSSVSAVVECMSIT